MSESHPAKQTKAPGIVRQRPRWSELAPLLKRQPKQGTRLQRKLARAADIEDLRRMGKRRTPRAPFDYVDGAAEDERSLARARDLYADLEFVPDVLRDVTECDPSTEILGKRSAYPFGFAPTGFTRMMHHEGEPAVAAVAAESGIPYVLSTLGTTGPERLAETVPDGDRWFQLYVWKDRAVTEGLLERVRASGFRALVLTVDLPVGGVRRRDVRNGMTIPPDLSWRVFVDGAMHPRWWWNFLTTERLRFATLESTGGTVADAADRLFDPSMTFEDLEWLRANWDGPIVVKGIQNVADARRSVDAGATGIILSNHGGRQLDRAPVTLRLVEPTAAEIGKEASVMVDGGIMNGADIVAAIALGADAAFVGRAYLYGLMAGGIDGVRRVATLLTEDVVRTMRLLGVSQLDQLTPQHVRLPKEVR